MVSGMYARANQNVDELRKQLASRFDGGMDRVAGAYKRQTQLVSFLIALALAVALNIDSVNLFMSLWARPAYAAQIARPGAPEPSELLQAVESMTVLPIGWTSDTTFPREVSLKTLEQASGWLLTALSVLFGAPFWFDALQRIVQIRGTGAKPSEKEKPK